MLDLVARQDILWLGTILSFSLVLSFGTVALLRITAVRLRFIDRPNGNTGNVGGAALGGGVGIVVATLVTLWLFPSSAGAQLHITAMMVALCALGLLDDIFKLTPLVKVLGQAACAALYIIPEAMNLRGAAFVMLFLIVSSNAWNVVDVMDSLLASIGAVAMFGISIVMLIHGLDPRGLPSISLVVSGALIGFLVWNRPPARVIMGDAGSLPLGMVYGALVVESFSDSALLALAVLLPGLIPYLEVGFLMVQRSRKGVPFYRSTPDHFALRLLHNGSTIAQIVKPVIWAGSGLVALACLLELTSFHTVLTIASAVLLAGAVVWAYRYLSRLRVGSSARDTGP
ncbi:MAG: undecaprenyl/decaprenyl-phosphate alpha-N-acetylglucosaminyl 1-phosphate transferase [candidate division Zixibacteria bacterium]|nr:undecaprenyl/decaprenyl-phosphate alpha-N-acetylglucosaminyl 1-phosphate transferase [candidate division Zixibacteria bacterium]